MEKLQEVIKQACENLDVKFYNGYSGRGMYGDSCIGVTGSLQDAMAVIAESIKQVKDNPVTGMDFAWVVDALLNFREDRLGRDTIVYWEELRPLDEESQEEDENPDD